MHKIETFSKSKQEVEIFLKQRQILGILLREEGPMWPSLSPVPTESESHEMTELLMFNLTLNYIQMAWDPYL